MARCPGSTRQRGGEALLGAFGSTGAVTAAGFDELASVDGIGEAVAASIVRAPGPEPVVEPKTHNIDRFPG